MRRWGILIIGLLFAWSCSSQSFEWVQQIGGTGTDQGYAVVTDNSSNVYAIGYFQKDIELGAFRLRVTEGSNDIYIARYDANGTVVWAMQSQSSSYIYGLSIASDHQGAIYVTGYFGESVRFDDISLTSSGYHDVFLVKLDEEGNVLWARRGGGKGELLGDIGRRVSVDLQGNVYLFGEFEGTASFGEFEVSAAGGQDVFLAKYDDQGQEQWVVSGGGSQSERGLALASDQQGSVYTGGSFQGSAVFDNEKVESTGIQAGFLTKYTNAGELVWVKQLSGSGEVIIRSLGVDKDQDLIFAGSFTNTIEAGELRVKAVGGEDFFLSKYSNEGTVKWIKGGGGNLTDRIYDVVTNEQGEIFVGGIFQHNIAIDDFRLSALGMSDALIAQYAPNGEARWVQPIGSTADDVIWDIATTGDHLFSTGSFFRTASFGLGKEIVLEAKTENKLDAFLSDTRVESMVSSSPDQSMAYSIRVFPNPGSGLINIELGQAANAIDTLVIYDAAGRFLKKVAPLNASRTMEISLDQQLAGQVLLLVFYSKYGSFSRKIVFER